MSKTERVNSTAAISSLTEYFIDAGQRAILHWDVMCQR